MDIAKNGSYANECYYKYYSEHEHFTKIVYANMLKRHFYSTLFYVKEDNRVHDMDLERTFEIMLCKLTLTIDEWCNAKGLLRKYKERRVIKKLDALLSEIYNVYLILSI